MVIFGPDLELETAINGVLDLLLVRRGEGGHDDMEHEVLSTSHPLYAS